MREPWRRVQLELARRAVSQRAERARSRPMAALQQVAPQVLLPQVGSAVARFSEPPAAAHHSALRPEAQSRPCGGRPCHHHAAPALSRRPSARVERWWARAAKRMRAAALSRRPSERMRQAAARVRAAARHSSARDAVHPRAHGAAAGLAAARLVAPAASQPAPVSPRLSCRAEAHPSARPSCRAPSAGAPCPCRRRPCVPRSSAPPAVRQRSACPDRRARRAVAGNTRRTSQATPTQANAVRDVPSRSSRSCVFVFAAGLVRLRHARAVVSLRH